MEAATCNNAEVQGHVRKPDAHRNDETDVLYAGDTHEPSLAKSAVHRSADNAETAHDVSNNHDLVVNWIGNRAHPLGFSRANLPPAGQTVDYHDTPYHEEPYDFVKEVTRQPINGVRSDSVNSNATICKRTGKWKQ